MQNNQETLLRVEHLCQYFGSNRMPFKAVDDVSFDIKKSEVFGLVGESGCGKTTTGRSIIKLYNITSGNIYYKGVRIGAGIRSYQQAIKAAKAEYKAKIAAAANGEEALSLKKELAAIIAENKQQIAAAKYDQKHCDHEYSIARVKELKAEFDPKIAEASGTEKRELVRRYKYELNKATKNRLVNRIQMIFQDPIASLDPRMTVREIIAEGLRIQGETDEAVINEKVYKTLEMVGLVREHATRYPHEFSGGQRQRIGIARAIIMEPEMIIADEPVSALDVSIQAQVINLLNELRDKLGLTILFIAHDLSVVKYFSDRIGVMYYGHLVELAPSDELFNHPLHPYTESLLSAIPLPDPEYEKLRKRKAYNPLSAHDYSVQQPTLREILPGHFVSCNDEEFERYKARIAELDAKKK